MSAASGSLGLESSSESSVSGSSAESKRSKDKESAKLPFPCPEFLAFKEKFLKLSTDVRGDTYTSKSNALIVTLNLDAPHWIFDARHFIEVLILIPKRPVCQINEESFVYGYLDNNIDDALNKLKEMLDILDKEYLEQYGQILMLGLINALRWFSKDFSKIEKIFYLIEHLIYEKNISPNFYLNDQAPFYNLINKIVKRIDSRKPEHLSIMEKMVSKFIKALIRFNFDFNSLPQGRVKFDDNDNYRPLLFALYQLPLHPLLINILTKILSLQANPLLVSARHTSSPNITRCALSLTRVGFSDHFPSPLPLLFEYGSGLMHREKRRELINFGNKAPAKLEHEIFFPFAKPDDSASYYDVTDSKTFAERLSTLRFDGLAFEEVDRLNVVCQNVLQAGAADPKVLAEGVLTAVEKNKDAIKDAAKNHRTALNSALNEYFAGYGGLQNIIKEYLSDALIPIQRVKIK